MLCSSKHKANQAAEIAFDNILGGCRFDEMQINYDFNYLSRNSTIVKLHGAYVTELGAIATNLIFNALKIK